LSVAWTRIVCEAAKDVGLVVEFCGLAGSGKSALAAHTCAALRRAGDDAVLGDLPVSAAAPPSAPVRRKVLASAAATEPVATTRVLRVVAATRLAPRDGVGLLAPVDRKESW
jgi:RecA/RadA recombinase